MFMRASDCQIASSTIVGDDNITPGCSSSPMKAQRDREGIVSICSHSTLVFCLEEVLKFRSD